MAATNISNDGSEDVSDFLRRIKELDSSGDEADAHNAKKLENDILEGRKQREARRAERARSISPEKQSPAASLRSYQSPRSPDMSLLASSSPNSQGVSSPPNVNSLGSVLTASNLMEAEPVKGSNGNEPETTVMPERPISTASAATSESPIPTRSGTLSWQQRPTSLRGPRSRPLSLVGRQSPSQPANLEPSRPEIEDDQPSRDQIAHALGSKDPSWFRQTPDRGVGSAAYRKAPEDNSSSENLVSQRRELHGLFREDRIDTEEPPSKSNKSEHTESSEKPPIDSKPRSDGTKEGLVISSEELAPQMQSSNLFEHKDLSFERSPRPSSPTKGVGDFVQSAMMRRSDSVGKRWSVQSVSSSGLQNSAAMRSVNSPNNFTTGSPNKIASGDQDNDEDGPSATEDTTTKTQGDTSTPTKPTHHRARSSASISNLRDSGDGRPPSPSKRWSPVKSSWLENALNKPPESPKPARPESMQPGWMIDLQRRRQQSATQDNKPDLAQAQSEDNNEFKTSFRSSVSYENPKRASNTAFQSPPVKPKPEFPSQISPGVGTQDLDKSIKSDSRPSSIQSPEAPSNSEPPNTISKPETPPKKDFRSSMQIREAPSPGKAAAGDLEFQNVFGKLRRTETKNYVAPDVLKDNILRGKAGLAVTGGPQKSARRDEFKESILQQKVAMKAKAADSSMPINSPATTKKEEDPIPEAIAKKKALSSTSGNAVSRSNTEPRSLPAVNAGASSGDKPTSKTTTEPVLGQAKPIQLEDRSIPTTSKSESITPSKTKTVGSSEKLAQSKLAGKFNPNLASLIAKGPPSSKPQSPSNSSERGELVSNHSTNRPATLPDKTGTSGAQLQHMTKSRARGPKRRLPKTHTNAQSPQSKPSNPMKTEPTKRASQGPRPTPPRSSRNVTPSKPFSATENASPQPRTSEEPQTSLTGSKLPSPKSSDLRQETEIEKHAHSKAVSGFSDPIPNILSNVEAKEAKISKRQSDAPVALNASDGAGIGLQSPVVKRTLDQQDRDSPNRPIEIPKRKPPIKLPTHEDEEKSHVDSGLKERPHASEPPVTSQESPIQGKEALLFSKDQQRSDASHSVTSPSVGPTPSMKVGYSSSRSPLSPKPPAGPKPSISRKPQPGSLNQSRVPLVEDETYANDPFEDFFDERPVADSHTEFDTQAILDSRKDGLDKVKTLRKHIVELTGDGKQIPLVQNEEHILFTSCMYLCTHIFGDAAGARVTEVYLWAGSRVSESAIEDAQIFARRAAKETNGKLILLRQNKESQNFLQSIGGIMITRDGTRSETSRPYMLCGRSHLGHITFDEVGFALDNLCSGFPFIVSPQRGIFYLWKGKGCNAEELGSARLISMDLGPTSKVLEVEEDKEPVEFLSIFPSSSKKSVSDAADYWRLKAKYDNYKTRLFRIDGPPASSIQSSTSSATATVNALWSYVRKSSQADIRLPMNSISHVTEICPFAQMDLEPEHIYVLDAFFELYIIVGSLTSSKRQEFARALLFAQDYAIVAASTEDRPSVPPGTVVFGSAPFDMKAHFRLWDDKYISTSALMAGHAKGGQRQSRLIPLNRAIEAIKVS